MKLYFWIEIASCLIFAVIAEARDVSRDLIRDSEFRNGFQVIYPDGSPSGDIRIPAELSTAEERAKTISWSITQWGSLYSILPSPVINGVKVTWLTPGYKRLTVDTQSHTLEFKLNSIHSCPVRDPTKGKRVEELADIV